MPAMTTTKAQFGDYPWMDSIPFDLEVIRFSPRWRAVAQLVITTVMAIALYAAYSNTEAVFKGVRSTGMVLPADAELPSWALLVFPLAALIPAIYCFLFLKYNFLR